jgi:hypothetical protein
MPPAEGCMPTFGAFCARKAVRALDIAGGLVLDVACMSWVGALAVQGAAVHVSGRVSVAVCI